MGFSEGFCNSLTTAWLSPWAWSARRMPSRSITRARGVIRQCRWLPARAGAPLHPWVRSPAATPGLAACISSSPSRHRNEVEQGHGAVPVIQRDMKLGHTVVERPAGIGSEECNSQANVWRISVQPLFLGLELRVGPRLWWRHSSGHPRWLKSAHFLSGSAHHGALAGCSRSSRECQTIAYDEQATSGADAGCFLVRKRSWRHLPDPRKD